MSESVVVIVDFDNFFPGQLQNYTIQELESFFTKIINLIFSEHNDTHNIIIRLYGGWYQGNVYTQKASLLATYLQQIDIFPIITNIGKVDGSIAIAEQQYGLDFVWYNTFQKKAGLQKVLIDHTKESQICSSNSEQCPVRILQKFIKNKERLCNNNGCTTKHQEILYRKEQKMIDTMMTCDVITYSSEPTVKAIYIASDDVDLFPCIAISKVRNVDKEITLLMKNGLQEPLYSNILSNCNAKVKTLI